MRLSFPFFVSFSLTSPNHCLIQAEICQTIYYLTKKIVCLLVFFWFNLNQGPHQIISPSLRNHILPPKYAGIDSLGAVEPLSELKDGW